MALVIGASAFAATAPGGALAASKASYYVSVGDSLAQAYLPRILAGLRAAAGPDVPIVGMSYYGVGLPAVWSATHDLSTVQAYIAQVDALNGLLESI
jgi:hypothetical protein